MKQSKTHIHVRCMSPKHVFHVFPSVSRKKEKRRRKEGKKPLRRTPWQGSGPAASRPAGRPAPRARWRARRPCPRGPPSAAWARARAGARLNRIFTAFSSFCLFVIVRYLFRLSFSMLFRFFHLLLIDKEIMKGCQVLEIMYFWDPRKLKWKPIGSRYSFFCFCFSGFFDL